MKPPRFVYHAPNSVGEALTLLMENSNARLLAGGQSLMPMLNMRLAHPDHLVDLNRVADLAYIREEDGGIAIGAMTRQRMLERSPMIAEHLPLMAEALRCVGHPQTRNRGTIGGSVCHLDPSAELPTVAMAYDATLSIAGAGGVRTLPFAEFPRGILTTALETDELLVALRFRPWPVGHGHCFLEYSRRKGDFAVVSAAALIAVDAGNRVTRLSLTLGGMAPGPVRLGTVEGTFVGAPLDETALGAAASAAAASIEALQDPSYPAWYRQHLASGLVARAITTAIARTKTGGARPIDQG